MATIPYRSSYGKRRLNGFNGTALTQKKTRVIQATPRSSPDAPQGNVISNVRMLSMTMMMRERKQMDVGPRGKYFGKINSVEAFEIQKGDILFTIMNGNPELPSANVGFKGDVIEKVYCHVGGIPVTAVTKFAGFCDTSPHTFKKDLDPDEAGAIARAGTRNITWNSPVEIHAHEHFYISMWPYSMVTEYGETSVITEVGQSPEKLRPTLYPFRDTNVHCSMLEITDLILQAKAKLPGAFDFNKIHTDLEQSPVLALTPLDYPLRHWASLKVMNEWLIDMAAGELNMDTLQTLCELFKLHYFDKWNAEMLVFASQIGNDPVSTYTSIAMSVDMAELLHETQVKQLYAKLLRAVTEAMTLIQSNLQNWLRGKVVGRALGSAKPGGNLDIMIGYTYC